MGRYGMAGNYYRRSGYVTLQDVPDPNREYVEDFSNLTGGMNRFDLDFKLKGNESPFIQNLSWHNGVLCSRWGQAAIKQLNANVVTCAPFLFHGWLIAHCQDRYVACKIQLTGEVENERSVGTVIQPTKVPPVEAGTFFRYREDVYYKARGVFHKFEWLGGEADYDHIVTSEAITDAFVPVIQMNTDPATGAGDLFQPENRMQSKKRVLYNATAAALTYQLPVTNVDSVDDVLIGAIDPITGEFIGEGVTPLSVDLAAGTITLSEPLTAGQNNVEITYTKANPDAMKSIMDCSVAAVFGGAQELCIVLAGSEAQPNAYFWTGNNGLVMDPTYFPMNQYNLAGDNSDPITAMGKQQNMLVLFQPCATGRTVFSTDKVNGLEQITMNYTRINAEIGCDLPGSLQLVENNLVWCNRKYGVCRLKDSSAAYENNIVVISRKINGDYRRPGLLQELSGTATADVHSVDTGRKYMLVFGTNAYEWNYELSEYSSPSWFFHKGIQGLGFIPEANDVLYEVLYSGTIAQFLPVYMDFGEPIEKIYEFPPRNFGSYDRVKNIKSVLFETRGDAHSNTQVTYMCDYGNRTDPTSLRSYAWTLVPRDLSFRDLSSIPFASVFRRKPGYHNIRHLKMKLYNNETGTDLSIVSAQIFYEFRGRQR